MNDAEDILLPGWSVRIRMLSSAGLWKSFLLVFGIPVTLISIVVSFAAGTDNGIVVLLGGWGLFAFLWALVGAIIDVSGGFTASCVLTDPGCTSSWAKGRAERPTRPHC